MKFTLLRGSTRTDLKAWLISVRCSVDTETLVVVLPVAFGASRVCVAAVPDVGALFGAPVEALPVGDGALVFVPDPVLLAAPPVPVAGFAVPLDVPSEGLKVVPLPPDASPDIPPEAAPGEPLETPPEVPPVVPPDAPPELPPLVWAIAATLKDKTAAATVVRRVMRMTSSP
ncbi:hypothetical protein [Microvirga rosea]|uniref:hypothetical protein n=1 Tax=Microvirga rosea TaxID=2715425 RepID=UPI001D0BCC49|nr:hypothetical protein [Microvirga rosea]MCB8819325.1 hypothetical protein [Microvirga rosea]